VTYKHYPAIDKVIREDANSLIGGALVNQK